MSALAAAASDEDCDKIIQLQQQLGRANALNRIRLDRVRELEAGIKRLHGAKGRHHTQLAACDLFDMVGLKNERPTK